MEDIRKVNIAELMENKEKFHQLLVNYYAKVSDELFNPITMFQSISKRIVEEGSILLVWGNYDGFITCDFKFNPIKQRKEAVIWTVYNPQPRYKASVLNMIEHEARKREVDTIVFFAEKPIIFNKLVKNYGYNCALGYFEKELKGEKKCLQ